MITIDNNYNNYYNNYFPLQKELQCNKFLKRRHLPSEASSLFLIFSSDRN